MRHLLLAVIVLSGCTGEVTPEGGSTGPTSPDAGSSGGGGGGGGGVGGLDAGGTDASGFACRNKVASVGSGHHNSGQDCQGSCHNHGFTLAGTIYANTTTPLSGASITITDAGGKSFDIVSQANGNFYTSQTINFPVTVTASECPSVAPMVTQVTATMDGCNKGGCHVTGAQGRIHLP
jgi:hypothetical protein